MADRLRTHDRLSSPFVLLRTQASKRPEAIAVVEQAGATQHEVTWGALFREVHELAAGLLSSGVRADHVALMAMSPGHQTTVVELALRSIGAVPVRFGPGAGVAEAITTFTVAPISLVVVDRTDRVDEFTGLPLGRAKLLDLTDTANLADLVDVGRGRLRQEPDAIAHADRMVATHATLPRVVTVNGDSVAPSAEPRQAMLLTPRDRVLLVGEPSDPFTMQVRSASLGTGAALAWIGEVSKLAETIQGFQPTVLALDHESATRLEPLLLDAHVSGRRWHSAPGTVLDAVAAVAGEVRVPRGARRRAAAISHLRPWFGADLTQILVAAETSPRLRAALDALDVDLDVEAGIELVPADLPKRAAKRVRPRPPLPQRHPGPVDPKFAALALPEPEPDPEDEEDEELFTSAHLRPLLTGESFLDRVLAEQAAAARASVPAATG